MQHHINLYTFNHCGDGPDGGMVDIFKASVELLHEILCCFYNTLLHIIDLDISEMNSLRHDIRLYTRKCNYSNFRGPIITLVLCVGVVITMMGSK